MDFLADVVAFFGDRANWRGGSGLGQLITEHVVVSMAALSIALVLALPLGLVLGHVGKGGLVAVNVSNVGRALPSFAVLVIALQLSSIGLVPTMVALVALAVPPMVTNSYTGVRGVDPDQVEAARAMGMTGRQIFTGVELPAALPLVMAGVRTAAVQVVATATLAALVGFGGLGALILVGLRTGDTVEVFAGALAVTVLAMATEFGLSALQRRLTPAGLRGTASQDDATGFSVV